MSRKKFALCAALLLRPNLLSYVKNAKCSIRTLGEFVQLQRLITRSNFIL